MATSAKAGYKTLFMRGNGATPELFTIMAEVKSIGGPSFSRPTFNVSNMDSSNWHEFIAGLCDGGEINLDLNLLPADAMLTTAAGDLTDTAATNYIIAFTNYGDKTDTFATDYASDDQLDAVGHGLYTGLPTQATSDGSPVDLPAGLAVATTYWIHWISADAITLHTTNAGAVADSGGVEMTDDGTGTHSLNLGTRWILPGYISGLVPNGPVDDRLSVTATFKVTGAPTLT